MNSSHVTAVLPRWVSPFGYLRIIAYLPLPEAFRSLSRPSSAPDAKAFPLRSFKLDLHCPPGRNRSRPGEVISLVLLAVLELCRLHRRFFRKIVVLPLFFHAIFYCSRPFGRLPSVALLFLLLCSVFKVQLPVLRPEQNTQIALSILVCPHWWRIAGSNR